MPATAEASFELSVTMQVNRCETELALGYNEPQALSGRRGGIQGGARGLEIRGRVRALLDSEPFCKLIIVACALIWGYSFVVMKDAVVRFPVFWLLAFRFLFSAAAAFVIFRRQVMSHLDRRTIGFGIALGLLGWLGYAFQTWGITITTPGKNAFLTGCYCVIVPFCAWMIGLGRPERFNIIGALICVVGLGFVALDNGFPLNLGDLLTLAGSFFYALQIAEVSKRGPDLNVWAISMWEFLTMGVASMTCSVALETAPRIASFGLADVAILAFLSLICSLACLIGDNHAFTKVDPTAGSLLASLEAPSGTAFSVLLAGEALTPRVALGFVLIFIAVVFSEAGPAIIGKTGRRRGKAA